MTNASIFPASHTGSVEEGDRPCKDSVVVYARKVRIALVFTALIQLSVWLSQCLQRQKDIQDAKRSFNDVCATLGSPQHCEQFWGVFELVNRRENYDYPTATAFIMVWTTVMLVAWAIIIGGPVPDYVARFVCQMEDRQTVASSDSLDDETNAFELE